MLALTGELLLSAWEKGLAEHDIDRALSMLALALPETSRDSLAELPIAERDILLLQLRAITFGPWLQGFASCSSCGTSLEFSLSIETLLERNAHISDEMAQDLHLRPVNSKDLLAILSASDVADAEKRLLSRCLVSQRIDTPVSPATRKEFELLNSAAEMSFALDCPNCSKHEVVAFDIARFLWAEVQRTATHLLSEIHVLASAYGWSECAIAAMAPRRRMAYMEMLNA